MGAFSSMLKDLIQEVNANNKLARETQDKASRYLKDLANKLNDKLKEFNLSIYNLTGNSGIATTNWNPSFVLNPQPLNISNKYFLYTGNEFLWSSHYYLYPHCILNEPPPYDTEKLLNICKSFEEEHGIKIEIISTNIIGKIEGYPSSKNDLLVLHPDGKILAFGNISYMGWDCKDQYGIIEDDSGKHLYYGTSGHSSEMNNYLPPNSDYNKFFDLHKENDTYIDNIDYLKELLK